jgi:DNA invertase Pin-like site-specific DNA recombinase
VVFPYSLYVTFLFYYSEGPFVDVACYVRVSTDDQSLDRQLTATHDRAESLGADPGEIVTYRDKATGTNIDRDDYHALLEDVAAGEYDAVVVQSVSRVARSIRDFEDAVEHIVEEHDTALHIVSEGFDLVPGEEDPYQRAMLQMLGVFAELEAEMTRQRVKEGIRTRMQNDDYHHGPAPLGFDKNDGRLIEAATYDRVVAVLEGVRRDELSKRKAARQLDTSRATINRALDRAELYGLPE